MKLEHSLTSHTKINSKWIKHLNLELDTIKLLEKNIGRTLFDINHSDVFLKSPPSIMKIKTKIFKWDLIKLKSFCTIKKTVNEMKRQPTEWEKIFSNKVANRRLISKIYKELMQLYVKKTNNPIKKWAEDLNRHFLQRRHTDD